MNFDLFVSYEKKISQYRRDAIRHGIIWAVIAVVIVTLMFGPSWPVAWYALPGDGKIMTLLFPLFIVCLPSLMLTHGSHPTGYYDEYDAVLPNGIHMTKSVYEALSIFDKRYLFGRKIDEHQICG